LRGEDFKIPNSVNIPSFFPFYLNLVSDLCNECLNLSPEHFMERYKTEIPMSHQNIILFGDRSEEAEVASFVFQIVGFPFVSVYRGGVQDWFGSEFKVQVQMKPHHEFKLDREVTDSHEKDLMPRVVSQRFKDLEAKRKEKKEE
jgi:3-mercaptopyruvate sulfurtransferase SseA